MVVLKMDLSDEAQVTHTLRGDINLEFVADNTCQEQ
jgi:hypothetical protein